MHIMISMRSHVVKGCSHPDPNLGTMLHGFLKYGTPKNISLPLFMVITWGISRNSGTTPYPTAFHIPPKRNTYLENHGNFNKKLDIPEPQTICKKYGVNRRYPLVNIQKAIEHCHRNSWFTHCHRNGGSFHSCYGTVYQRVATMKHCK